MPGKHNALNALAAFSIAVNLNLSPKKIVNAIKSFRGIERRFSIITKSPKILIDDYAHHPNEIKSIVDSVKKMYPNKSNLVIFHTQVFSWTQEFMSVFARAVEKIDIIFRKLSSFLDLKNLKIKHHKFISEKKICSSENVNNLIKTLSQLNLCYQGFQE